MDIQAYISSGVIEAYVLGMATDSESREVERLAGMHPEVRQYLADTQQAMESLADAVAVPPPPALKQNIWHAINREHDNTGSSNVSMPVKPVIAGAKSVSFYKIMLAASVLLLIASIAFNVSLWNKTNKTQLQLAGLERRQDTLLADNKNYQAYLSLINSPQVQSVKLDGVGTHTSNSGLVLWNKQTKEVYMSFNNLPPPPQGSQYQLWAIVDSKPVDMGVFDLSSQPASLQKMKTVQNVQMFAVTLERAGGSPAPTLDQMYIAGKI